MPYATETRILNLPQTGAYAHVWYSCLGAYRAMGIAYLDPSLPLSSRFTAMGYSQRRMAPWLSSERMATARA